MYVGVTSALVTFLHKVGCILDHVGPVVSSSERFLGKSLCTEMVSTNSFMNLSPPLMHLSKGVEKPYRNRFPSIIEYVATLFLTWVASLGSRGSFLSSIQSLIREI